MKVYTLVLFASIIVLTSSSHIVNLTDANFESYTNRGLENPWVVMFYVPTCQYCKMGNQFLEKAAKLIDKDQEVTKIGKIDCNENMYACLRFNITRVPTIIIIQNEYVYEDTGYLTESSLMSFIKSEKELGKGKPLPEVFGYLQFFLRSLSETMIQLNKFMKQQFKTRLGVDIEWGNFHSSILFLLIFILTFTIEFLLFSWCLKKKKVVRDAKPAEPQAEATPETKNENVKEETSDQNNNDSKEKKD